MPRPPHSIFAVLLIFTIFLSPTPLAAQDLKAKKGPVLHYIGGKLQVRIQGKFKHPQVQWKDSGQQKDFPMKKDNRRYWEADLENFQGEYRVVDGAKATPWIPILNQEPSAEKFRFVAYGSNQTGVGHGPIHENLLRQMATDKPSLILHTGGLVGNGGDKNQWNQFFLEGQPIFQSIPFQPAIGSSDRSKGGRFASNTDMGDNNKTRYHYQYGGTHFIALDTTRNFRPGSKQYKFLQKTLEGIRGQSPIIVYFYHPAFSASVMGGDQRVLDTLVPLFEDYGVDLVLSGQEHGYQRIGPVNGVTYIVTGGGGTYPTNITPDPNLAQYKSLYHYMFFEVDGEKIVGQAKGPRGEVEDSFEIVHGSNPVPKGQRQARPQMKKSRRYKYAAPY